MGRGSLHRGLWPQGAHCSSPFGSQRCMCSDRSSRTTQRPLVKVPLGPCHLQSSGEYSVSLPNGVPVLPLLGSHERTLRTARRACSPHPPTCSEKRGSEEAVGRDGHRSVPTPTPGVLACVTVVSSSNSLITKLSGRFCTEWSFKTRSWLVHVSFKTNLNT